MPSGIRTRTSGIMIPAYVLPVGLDAATTAWVNAVVTNGGTVSAGRQTTVNTLITTLKSAGIWTKLDRLWLWAAENQPSALTDLVGLSLATAVNSPCFTADRGYTGNGSTSYIDTLFDPTTGTAFNQNSCHFSVWVRTLDTNTQILCGSTEGGIQYSLLWQTTPRYLGIAA